MATQIVVSVWAEVLAGHSSKRIDRMPDEPALGAAPDTGVSAKGS